MKSLKVGVLRGGNLNHDFSLRHGKEILSNLPENYLKNDIYISKKGDWFLNGKLNRPERIFQSADIFLNTIQGDSAHKILEYFHAPCAGSDFFHSVLALNRWLARERLLKFGFNLPQAVLIDSGEHPFDAGQKIFKQMSPAYFLKPARVNCGQKARHVFDIDSLIENIGDMFHFSADKIIAEQEIFGRKAACGVIENFRNQQYYALPPAEIIPLCKYKKTERSECPSHFDLGLKRKIEELAIEAHKALGCKHYSESVFAITPQNKIYILEICTRFPQKESVFSKSLDSIGSSFCHFLEHIVNLAAKRKEFI